MPVRADLVDPLLVPIAGDNPSGHSVREDPAWEAIKDARREDLDVDQGQWQRARKVAEPAQVIKLVTPLLAEQSKDLQLAAWWTEAQLRRDGLQGLRDGLALLRGLLEGFWETLYPEIEDGDASLRAGPLEFVGVKLLDLVRAAPMNAAKHGYFQYDAAVLAGTSEEASRDEAKRNARASLEGLAQPFIEEILVSVDATPKTFYRAQLALLGELVEEVVALNTLGDERFADEAPSWTKLLSQCESLRATTQLLLQRRLEQEPDPVEESADPSGGDAGATVAAEPTSTTPLPTSAADATQRVVVSARWLRRERPTDPTPYALLRALRWQELRALPDGTGAPPAELLSAPPTAQRAKLKALQLEQQWEALLDGVEELTAATPGAAWLDAQRWAIEASAALGPDYEAVQHALRTALRALLADFPRLPHATLLDDSPVANAETLAWLERSGLYGGIVDMAPLEGLPATPRRPKLAQAKAEAAAGRLDRGVALLMVDIAREKSERARFLRRVELVTVLLDAGKAAVAMPIVEEMLEQVEEHKLDTWEDGDQLARALVLACRAIDATDGDSRQRAQLYLRICRLDPVAAIALGG
ncbi:MAG: type VI secretion system protein TssA [Gemmatimonadaceae bacterium]|nr:type VI secretion system protein TssA [Gemmatimonadaceae bacterium]